jgi:hypothetical protein
MQEQHMRNGRTIATLAMAAALGFGLTTNLSAQEVQVPEQEPIEVTTELLERFVAVYPEVMVIAEATQAEMIAAETPDQAEAIQSAAQERILAALAEGEVSPQEYEAVVARLNEDEELRAEFQRMLEAATEDHHDHG